MANANDEYVPIILVVDDTVENLQLLVGILSREGFDVRPVTNGRDALKAAAEDTPDLVLLDVTMPGMDGFEVCTQLRALKSTQDVPVIFLTALSDVEQKLKGFSAGGTDYVTKPFQVDEVLARVATHLALRRARKDLEYTVARLREAEQFRDDLANMIVHDMRSPLAVLLGHLELMSMDATGDLATSLDEAAGGAKRLKDMADTLLDVSRMEEGRMPLTRVPTDLAALARSTRDAMSKIETDRTIEVMADDRVDALCDAGLIQRVLENLVANAIKHTPRKGSVRIVVMARNGGVRVAVEDEGDGVPEDTRSRIFEKFGSAIVRKDMTYHSVGLGLAFCKLAVEAHGGSISVADAVPHGSVFAFELPG